MKIKKKKDTKAFLKVGRNIFSLSSGFLRCGNKNRDRIVSKQFRRGISRHPRLKGNKFAVYLHVMLHTFI